MFLDSGDGRQTDKQAGTSRNGGPTACDGRCQRGSFLHRCRSPSMFVQKKGSNDEIMFFGSDRFEQARRRSNVDLVVVVPVRCDGLQRQQNATQCAC